MSQLSQRMSWPRVARTSWLLAVLSALLLCTSGAAADRIDQPAPDFALRSFDGQNVRLSEQLGEVVILNFWATWCGPCRQEMPALDEIYAKYRLAGLVLLSINIDDDRDEAIEMARTMKVSYPVLYDADKNVARAYEPSTLPVTILIDRAGAVRYISEGYKPGYEQRYTEKLRELLNE